MSKIRQVGKLIKTKSNTYGTYYQRCVALIDLINGNPSIPHLPDVDDVMNWLDKFHPKTYFRSYGFKSSQPDSTWSFYVYIVLHSDNHNWAKENLDCKYMKSVSNPKEVKGIPIGISTKKLSKWLFNSSDYLVDAIEVSDG